MSDGYVSNVVRYTYHIKEECMCQSILFVEYNLIIDPYVVYIIFDMFVFGGIQLFMDC